MRYSSSHYNERMRMNIEKENSKSINSLKKCFIIFIIVLFEMVSNVFCRILTGTSNLYYTYFCKLILVIDMLLIIGHCMKLSKSYWSLYINGLNVCQQKYPSIVCVLFDLFPHLKVMVETILASRLYNKYFNTKQSEEIKLKNRLNEERRRSLYRAYLPSMDTDMTQSNFNNTHLNNWNDSVSAVPTRCVSTPCKNTVNLPQLDQYSPISTPQDYGGDARIINRFASDVAPTAVFTSPSSMFYGSENFRGPHKNLCGTENQYGVVSKMRSVSADQYWRKMNIDPRIVDEWIDNLKLWVHTTILNRVVQEIDVINRRLEEIGLSDVKIGESSIQTLRMLLENQANQQVNPGASLSLQSMSATRPTTTTTTTSTTAATTSTNTRNSRQLPTSLHTLITFLDCSKDQAYVVNRLRELSQGLSLSRYAWNNGSSHPKHPWREHLPNDATLILHLFTSYIDSKHYSSSTSATAAGSSIYNSFSQQFIIDATSTLPHSNNNNLHHLHFSAQQHQPHNPLYNNPSLGGGGGGGSESQSSSSCLLLQSVVQPPHFRILTDNSSLIINVPAGRSNLFECLLIFLYKVYHNETNFKWLNLGRAGLNLNWIFK